jgi:hypothetical protein
MLALRRLTTEAAPLVPHSLKPRRPKISAANPRKWSRPLIEGVLPAYDEALRLIRRDSNKLKAEADALRAALFEAESSRDTTDETLSALRKRLAIVEVQSEVNLPDVRWRCANKMGMNGYAAHLCVTLSHILS